MCEQASDLEWFRKLHNFLLTEQYFDVNLICKTEVFRAHKTVLAAASDTIKNLLLICGAAPGETCHISVPDIDAGTMQKILQIIYCGFVFVNVDELNNITEGLIFLGINTEGHIKVTDGTWNFADDAWKVTDDQNLQVGQTMSEETISGIDKYVLILEKKDYLERVYQFNPRPDLAIYKELQQKLQVTLKYLQSWFSKRRAKDRRAMLSAINGIHNNTEVASLCNIKEEILDEQEDNSDKENANITEEVLPCSILPMPEQRKENCSLEEFYCENKYPISNIHPVLQRKLNIRKSKYSSLLKKKHTLDQGTMTTVKLVSKEKKLYLEKIYKKTKFPTFEMYIDIQEKLKLPRMLIRNWFSKRRKRDPGLYLNKNTEEPEKSDETSTERNDKLSNGNSEASNNMGLSENQIRLLELAHERKKNIVPSEKIVRNLSKNLKLRENFVLDWFVKRAVKDRDGSNPARIILTKTQLLALELEYRKMEREPPQDKTVKYLSRTHLLTSEFILDWFKKRAAEDLLVAVDTRSSEEGGSGNTSHGS